MEPVGLSIEVPVGSSIVKGELYKAELEGSGVIVYAIKCDAYYDRAALYGTSKGDYKDNLERFVFFSRGVLEAVKALELKVDLLHCNDWQTGLIPAYLKTLYKDDSVFSSTSTLFTIHNLAYQGIFKAEGFEKTGLPKECFSIAGMEFWGKLNLLKSAVVYSDLITTVSKTYSKDIQSPKQGMGLDGVLRAKAAEGRLFGVLNGADYDLWSPETDDFIVAKYGLGEFRGKAICKKALLKEFSLKVRPATPVIGMVSRLADQKGFDILEEAIEEGLFELDMGIIVLGAGDVRYERLLKDMAAKYPTKLKVHIGFDEALAHRIEAGADFFLMPSRYEPCGLNQIYSMRYGTIPIVRATGGLDDTVIDYDVDTVVDYNDEDTVIDYGDSDMTVKAKSQSIGTGFKFSEYSGKALLHTIERALAVFFDKGSWRALRRRAMAEDFSWDNSARRYMELYRLALTLS
jgi:starch synthase